MKYPVAIIDYGIGGLGLYKLICDEFPKMPLLYFSDSGEVPYGKLSKDRLRARLDKVFRFLEEEGAQKIVVACHSASSVVLDTDAAIGLRQQTIKAVLKLKPKSVGIIGGGRTIRSGYYRRELNKAGIKTSQRIAQQLSILVERGEVDTAAVEEAVLEIIAPLRSCEAILLACTHYPALSHVISRYYDGKLIDPAMELYKWIYKYLSKDVKGPGKFLTTGNTELMAVAARRAFNVSIHPVKKVTF